MSEFAQLLAVTENEAGRAIAAAVAAGVQAHPDVARAVVVEKLEASFGPVVEKIIDLIKAGFNSLPAILQALQAAGVALPSWVSVLVSILLAVAA